MNKPANRIEVPLRDRIRKNATARVQAVEVPEWKTIVWVRALTADEFYQIVDADDSESERLWDTVARYTVDEQGTRVFTDDNDLAWLRDQPATALQRIVSKIRELNTISQDSIEESEKN